MMNSVSDIENTGLLETIQELREISKTLGEYKTNITHGEAALKERSLDVRERTAHIVDAVATDIEHAHKTMLENGVFAEDPDIKVKFELDKNDLEVIADNTLPKWEQKNRIFETLQQAAHKHGTDSNQEWNSAVSVLIHAVDNGANKTLRRLGINSPQNGAIVTQFDAFETYFMNNNIIPIGEYGRGLSERLCETMRRTGMILDSSREAFLRAEEVEGQSEIEHFVRGRDKNPNDPTTMLTLYEGILSIQQTISLLAAQRIPGYNFVDEDTLVSDLISSGLIEQLARIMPYSGVIGPASILGLRIDNLVTYQNGRFILNREVIKAFHEERLRYRTHFVAHPEKIIDDQYNSLNGCPAAIRIDGKPSSVTKMAELFGKIFEGTKS